MSPDTCQKVSECCGTTRKRSCEDVSSGTNRHLVVRRVEDEERRGDLARPPTEPSRGQGCLGLVPPDRALDGTDVQELG
ncbi:MAG TPA: hypothetical protein VFI34_00740, partial [Candidatus Limnocylindrales bacterium]|nr:hypothetical protein [Candidatus Limnocylindrales bacterium]